MPGLDKKIDREGEQPNIVGAVPAFRKLICDFVAKLECLDKGQSRVENEHLSQDEETQKVISEVREFLTDLQFCGRTYGNEQTQDILSKAKIFIDILSDKQYTEIAELIQQLEDTIRGEEFSVKENKHRTSLYEIISTISIDAGKSAINKLILEIKAFIGELENRGVQPSDTPFVGDNASRKVLKQMHYLLKDMQSYEKQSLLSIFPLELSTNGSLFPDFKKLHPNVGSIQMEELANQFKYELDETVIGTGGMYLDGMLRNFKVNEIKSSNPTHNPIKKIINRHKKALLLSDYTSGNKVFNYFIDFIFG